MGETFAGLVERAQEAVSWGVRTLMGSEATDGRVFRESGRDIKLEADLLLSREISGRLLRDTGLCCLSEEDVHSHGFPEDEPVWILDPLDGSMNFARGVPLYCVSLALWQSGVPVIGIVYDIPRGRILTACAGMTLAEGTTVRIGTVTEMQRAVLATGFPLLTDTSSEALGWFLRFTERFKKIRMLGSAALSLAWVAEGRLDAYFERDIMLWDVAAGLALVEGAGGVWRTRPGRHHLSVDVLATNPVLAEIMQKELKWE